jgi:hypothetical protein
MRFSAFLDYSRMVWTHLAAILLLTFAGNGWTDSDLTDTTPPTLVDFSFDPTSVDVSTGSADVTVHLHFTDDLSGFGYAYVYFYSPSSGQYVDTYFNIESGTSLDGYAVGHLTIPQFSEAGN